MIELQWIIDCFSLCKFNGPDASSRAEVENTLRLGSDWGAAKSTTENKLENMMGLVWV